MSLRPLPTMIALMAKSSRKKLLDQITRRFDVVTEPLSFGPLRLEFTRVADPDVVLDRVADEGGSSLPYWAELWESSLAIAEYLVKRYSRHDAPTMEKLSVLDLGCGQGLEGAVAARLGAHVLLADIEPDALLFAAFNSAVPGDRVRTLLLDWQKDRLDETFDLVLGADIIYERSQWDFLEPFWRVHLKPHGIVLLGEPNRQSGETFIPWIKERGWTLTRQISEAKGRAIRLLELNLPSSPPFTGEAG